MPSERCIKLSCRDSHDFHEARDSLLAFLEDFRALEVEEAIVLAIDVTEMPLFVDINHLREIIDVLARYEDCFRKVARLKIIPAAGVQEMIVRGTVGLMPLPFPIDIHVRDRGVVQDSGI